MGIIFLLLRQLQVISALGIHSRTKDEFRAWIIEHPQIFKLEPAVAKFLLQLLRILGLLLFTQACAWRRTGLRILDRQCEARFRRDIESALHLGWVLRQFQRVSDVQLTVQ